MGNKFYVYNENGEEIVIDVVLSFIVEELNKTYLVYTLNDDGISEKVPVLISEYDGKTIKDIQNDEADIVLQYYESAKELLNE